MSTTFEVPPEQHLPFSHGPLQDASLFSAHLESAKQMSTIIDEKGLKDELIQQATTRLRRRLLEERLLDVLNEVSRVQTLLETVRIEAVTTAEAMAKADDMSSPFGLETLEKRLQSHQQQLEQINGMPKPSPLNVTTSTSTSTAMTASTSLSSTLSRISSLFSRPTTKHPAKHKLSKSKEKPELDIPADTDTEQDDMSDHNSQSDEVVPLNCPIGPIDAMEYDIECNTVMTDEMSQQRRDRRRKRVKQLREHYLKRLQLYDPMWTELDWKSTHSSTSECPSRTPSCIRRRSYTTMNSVMSGSKHNVAPPLSSGDGPCCPLETNTFDCHPHCVSPSCSSQDIDMPTPITKPTIFVRRHEPLKTEPMMLSLDNETPTNNPGTLTPSYALQSWLSEQTTDCESSVGWNELDMEQWLPERNILEEALSFLDGVGEDGDDGGFGDDIEFLLGRPDLCCRPLAEVRDTMSAYRQRQYRPKGPTFSPSALLWPSTWINWGARLFTAGLQWCRFITVLGLTIVISLCSGPQDMHASKYTLDITREDY